MPTIRYRNVMESRYFDAHTHAHFPAYGDESRAVVKRAQDIGVDMILVGTEKGTSQGAIDLAVAAGEGVWAAVGLHPTHTTPPEFVDPQELADVGHAYEAEVFEIETYRRMAQHPKVVAIGECGLDYYRLDPVTARVQQDVLIQHLHVSHEVQKPLTIHCRNAFHDLIPLLKNHKELLINEPGTIHFFTGTQDDAKALMNLGFSLQFGGVITFAKVYEELVRYVPLERIITETDAPYVAPVPYRGKRNEPAYVVEVVKKIAALKVLDETEVRTTIRENVKRVFKI